MQAALERILASGHFDGVVLIGYSGGGTLAMLLAARVPETRGVITIAGNLDIRKGGGRLAPSASICWSQSPHPEAAAGCQAAVSTGDFPMSLSGRVHVGTEILCSEELTAHPLPGKFREAHCGWFFARNFRN
jgi:pimeloyl-ACP methyl ester carboxylesterase